jgi:hypothetical protein
VALTIDTDTQPPHVLLVRATASMEMVARLPPCRRIGPAVAHRDGEAAGVRTRPVL